ncbi:hypothetical protein H0P51_18290 [Mycobacterium vicinigordonae]|uniref:Outer membrane protein n=2 Tax=Mycobacterium vicinigordonae TaxID=1719132 RepID=A0A7D6EAP9_9MYCO|nr:hypothetical protein [Mycobacterium vicinigordonae]QLL10323.1 hypothetical protein H0P51_18290 [Mycobacterium vicinigordonae]
MTTRAESTPDDDTTQESALVGGNEDGEATETSGDEAADSGSDESEGELHDESEDELRDESDDRLDGDAKAIRRRPPIARSRVLAFGVLPGIALLLALTAGYFKWVDLSGSEEARARAESVRVASDDAVALLSYSPESAEKELGAARERLTGDFKDAYTSLTRQVVIPGAKQKHITAVAKVTAASSVSATQNHAVVLLFANQTVIVGDGGTPTDTQPVIRVTLDKVGGRWLVSRFDPV